jgi:uncharacterized membrane protein YedE/YeeE
MKRKYITVALLAAGILLIVGAVFFAAVSAGNKDIIGGADLPTISFVFFRGKGGAYGIAALSGLFCILSAIVLTWKTRR